MKQTLPSLRPSLPHRLSPDNIRRIALYVCQSVPYRRQGDWTKRLEALIDRDPKLPSYAVLMAFHRPIIETLIHYYGENDGGKARNDSQDH